jgi:hypothetical protein
VGIPLLTVGIVKLSRGSTTARIGFDGSTLHASVVF